MKQLDLATLFSVFQEMFGVWLYVLIAAAIAITAATLFVLLRDRHLSPARLVRAEVIGLFGGFLTVIAVQRITDSGFSDIGGPVDVILLALIWIAGAVGTAMLAYLVQSLQPPSA